jgi:hypothetical protein
VCVYVPVTASCARTSVVMSLRALGGHKSWLFVFIRSRYGSELSVNVY